MTEGLDVSGLPIEVKKSRKWFRVEDLRPHLQPIVDELGRMPTGNELKARNRIDLTGVIRKFGGYPAVAESLGFPYITRSSWADLGGLHLHLQPIVNELSRMPTEADLMSLKRFDLMAAIKKFAGYPAVAEALGFPYTKHHTWNTLEDLHLHLQPIVDELGRMPTESELKARKRLDLTNAIKKFGGYSAVAASLGYPYTKQNSWRSLKDLHAHLQPMVDELGHMPTENDLNARNRTDLISVIRKFGGYSKVAEALGYHHTNHNSWGKIEDLRPHLKPLVDELGRMPTKRELKAHERGDLAGAIQKFGGYSVVAKALDYPYVRHNSWESLEDLRPHLQPIVDELGRMPTENDLIDHDRTDLTGVIGRFGGYPKVAEALGYPYTKRSSWKSMEDLRPHLQPLVEELGRVPTDTELTARSRFDLMGAIRKFGGHRKVAQALGYSYKGYTLWPTVEDLRPHLQPLVDELGRMPGQLELKARNRFDLVDAIHKFGGHSAVAQALGYPYTRNWWTSIEDLRPHLQPIVDELGHMPSLGELEARGYDHLRRPLEMFGGQAAVAKALGYPYTRKSWSSIEDLRLHLQPIVDELARMPNYLELKARNRLDLANAIRKFGGIARVAELLGYPYDNAPAFERHVYRKKFEQTLLLLHESQALSAGQIILLLRHANLLSKSYCVNIIRRLNPGKGVQSAGLEMQSAAMTAIIDDDGDGGNFEFETDNDFASFDDVGSTSSFEASQFEDQQVEIQAHLPRNRTVELKELRGWSAVGNLLDPTPALIQLSVTRLKTAFYRFANEQRMSLEAPSHDPSSEEIEQLQAKLWDAAFSEYGELIDNEFVQEACQMYITDLADALLLPRIESVKTPRLYQLDGARFLANRLSSPTQSYGLLFDQPGMGKTLTTLWALAAARARRFIIVAPLTVKRQVWTSEALQTAFPQMEETHIVRTLDAAIERVGDESLVVLLHYEELRRHEELRRLVAPRPDGSPPFDVLIFDEAHTVKERLSTGHSSGPTREGAWLLRRGARACIGLTATPVVNELYEPVSLLHLVKGQRDDSSGRHLQSRRLRDRVDVMEYLLSDSLRRLKTDVLFDIPPRYIQAHPITPAAEQLEQIQRFLSRGRRAVGFRLAEYRRLVLDAKLDWIVSVVGERYLTAVTSDGQPDPKVLILCYNVEGISRAVYARLVEEFGSTRVAHVDGETTMADRDDALRRFREPANATTGLAVLVGTIGTIGVGVTLFDPETVVTPHRVIFADLPFTWAEFEQGVDRLHRVGQRYPVEIEVPIINYGEQLLQADGEALQSFDEWVWDWILRKQLLADQVLDAAFDVSEYKDSAIRRAITQALKDIEKLGGTLIAPPPPPESEQAIHRWLIGRYRALPRNHAAELFKDPGMSERFLALNDASPSAKLAQRLVRERLMRWLDKRSVVVDLGCGSNPLRDLPCAQVIGIDRHGVNGGLVSDSAASGLPPAEADFVVFSLSMWGTSQDRLNYLREAKRLLRPIGKLILIEPAQTFGGAQEWKAGVARLETVLKQLGMQAASASEHIVDSGARLVAVIANNSNEKALENIDPDSCIWANFE